MKKQRHMKLSGLVSLVLVIGLIASGCAPPAPAPATEETPTPETLPTEAPSEESMPETTDPPAAIAGQWQGKIVLPGLGLEILVNFGEDSGTIEGTIDIPAQGASGIPLHSIQAGDSTLHFEMLDGPRLAVFDGAVQPDGTIEGSFTQAGVEGDFELARPEPVSQDPLPYLEEEVVFGNDDISLAGTLTLPSEGGPFPAMILISGSGQQNRDEEIPLAPGYKPFQEIADHLTRQGIAVLRYDDRGVGDSTGDPTLATSADFAGDAEAALAYLLGREEISNDQIGLLGHSEGGLIAAMIAARNPQIHNVISMAGTAVDGYETIVKQVERAVLAAGGSQEDAAESAGLQREVLDLVVAQDWPTLQTVLEKITTEQLQALPEEQRATLGNLEAVVAQQTAAQMQAFQSPWYQFFLSYDPARDWAQVTVPVLGLYGELDTQVDATQNTSALQAALDQAGNSAVTIQVLPTANHLFQDAVTGSVNEYPMLKTDLVPGFLESISSWLLENR
ncbi:MAG: alpha/beta fold hydrolase [Chloroflexota bacterium]|nr:alpha/beta fold hydrolase [Chloroflexota bacterium]